jgi:glycosyltransferase involved in cell wall biosynthesis
VTDRGFPLTTRMPRSSSSLHILVLADRDWSHPQAGGTGTNLQSQVSRWLEWGHRVTVIACGYPGGPALERDGSLTIHRMGGRSTLFPRAIWRQWRKHVPDADVVLEVINGITFLTPLWLRTPRVALIHHIHRTNYVEEMGVKGRIAGFLLETLPLRVLYRGTRFLAVSQAAAADIAAHGIPDEQIQVNYNGVELVDFAPGARATEPTLLYLGRLKRYKHIEVLLDVVEQIPGAVLEIAGDGDRREHLEEEIERRGLGGRVRMHGFVSEERKRELLQSAWVNLTASSMEGWGLGVTEAAACATPSVAPRVGGLSEAIIDGVTGLLVDDGPGDFTAKTRLLIEDAELRERLGRAALERMRTFTWDRTAAQTLAALEAEHSREGALPPLADVLSHPENGRAAAVPPAVGMSPTAAVEETEAS